jgi:hypothetical protein
MNGHMHPTKPLKYSGNRHRLPAPEVIEVFQCNGTRDREGRCVKYAEYLRKLETEETER